MMNNKIKTFKEFYSLYLSEHAKLGTRIFHFLGILIIILVLFYVIKSGKERFLWYIPIVGYGFPWLSHLIFEKNKPTSFKYPLWNFLADFKLFLELLTGKQKFKI